MRADEKIAQQRVRVAVLGNVNVGKSGKPTESKSFASAKNRTKNINIGHMPKQLIFVSPISTDIHICSSFFSESALTVRYLTKRYIGEYRSKTDLLYRQTISLDSCLLDVEIVDVSAESENEFPTDQIQWADSCLIVYSITDRDSFKYATRALGNLKGLQNGFSAYLIANKADLDHLREVSCRKYFIFKRKFGFDGDCCLMSHFSIYT